MRNRLPGASRSDGCDNPERWDRLEHKETVQILDVRTPKEFKQGHIKNAINFPLGIINSDSLKKLNKELNYITYCAHGIRSVKASKILKENGFKVTNGGSIKDLQKLIAYSENRN